MTPRQAELYDRVMAFSFDAGGATYTFADRLARENGWSPAFAGRVIDEYRKFAFLAAVVDHPVSPSDAVDRAWHLHLVYTRNYWDEWCAKTLGMKFHHEPGSGLRDERARFEDWYARTLESYRRLFGAEPPADIWPAPEVKAKQVERFRRIDVLRHWVIPKSRLRAAALATTGAILVAIILLAAALSRAVHGPSTQAARPAFASLWAVTLNPFDLRGPDFLLFYAALTVAGILSAAMFRRGARDRDNERTLSPPGKLSAYEIAYLSGGATQAVDAAITRLVNMEILKPAIGGSALSIVQPAPLLSDPLENAVHEAVHINGTTQTQIGEVRGWCAAEVKRIAGRLEAWGLVLSAGASRSIAVRGTLLALAAPAIGAVKVCVGVSRGKPVGFLIVACGVSVVLAILLFARRPHRTRRGDDCLRKLKASYRTLKVQPRAAMGEALMLGVALYGLDFLAETQLNSLARTLRPPKQAASFTDSTGGCGGSSCGGSSCGGSSCGGGGGCGGGGCGGCGSS